MALTGEVLHGRPIVRVGFRTATGGVVETPVLVDTGCKYAVVLPRALAEQLRLPFVGGRAIPLADGRLIHAEVAFGDLLWLGREREAEVLVVDLPWRRGLVGTELLVGTAIRLTPTSVELQPLAVDDA